MKMFLYILEKLRGEKSMASFHEARKTGKFMGAYVCSNCKSVIIRDFEFYAVAYSRWTQKKAEEAAEAVTEQGIKALQAFRDKPFLVTCPTENRSYNLVTGFGTDRLERGCPYCGHKERWQLDPNTANGLPKDSETGAALVEDVPVMSRLLVTTVDGIKDVQVAMAAMITEQCKSYWKEHAEEAASIRVQIQNLKEQIAVLTAQKESVQACSQKLYAQMKLKEEQMKGLSLFSGERKACKAELKELENQYKVQSATDMEKVSQLSKTIQAYQNHLKEMLIKNPGILDEYEQVVLPNDGSIAAIRYN